jgi:hypothetical protein
MVPACMPEFDSCLRDKVYDIDSGFDLIDDRHAWDYRLD